MVFVVNGLLLSIANIHKMVYYYGFWGADVTNILMMNFTKLTAIAINYRDGGLSDEE